MAVINIDDVLHKKLLALAKKQGTRIGKLAEELLAPAVARKPRQRKGSRDE